MILVASMNHKSGYYMLMKMDTLCYAGSLMESGALYKMALALYFIPLLTKPHPYKGLYGYSYYLQSLYLNKYVAKPAQPKGGLKQLLNSWPPLKESFPVKLKIYL